MLTKTITLVLLSFSMTLSLINSPLTLGVWILTMAMLATILMTTTNSSWIAMMTFLIYIGGLLILFAYFLAIQPNNLMNIATHLLTSTSSGMILMMLNKTTNHHFTPTNSTFTHLILYNQNLSFLILLGLTLLLILVVVVKITY